MAAADSDSGASANIALYNNQSESIVFLNGPIHGVASGGYINVTLSLYGNFPRDSVSANMPEAIDLCEAPLAVRTGPTVLGADPTLLALLVAHRPSLDTDQPASPLREKLRARKGVGID